MVSSATRKPCRIICSASSNDPCSALQRARLQVAHRVFGCCLPSFLHTRDQCFRDSVKTSWTRTLYLSPRLLLAYNSGQKVPGQDQAQSLLCRSSTARVESFKLVQDLLELLLRDCRIVRQPMLRARSRCCSLSAARRAVRLLHVGCQSTQCVNEVLALLHCLVRNTKIRRVRYAGRCNFRGTLYVIIGVVRVRDRIAACIELKIAVEVDDLIEKAAWRTGDPACFGHDRVGAGRSYLRLAERLPWHARNAVLVGNGRGGRLLPGKRVVSLYVHHRQAQACNSVV